MSDLDKVKDIFLADDVDSEDYQDNLEKINNWERDLVENENLLNWQQHDITNQMFRRAKESYVELAILLTQNREMTDQERASVYAKQDAMLWFINMANPKEAKEVVNKINKDVKTALYTKV